MQNHFPFFKTLKLNGKHPISPLPAMKDMKMYPPYEEIIKQEE